MTLLLLLYTFLSGVAIELLYAEGVIVIAGRQPRLAGLSSILWSLAFLKGMKESWDWGWPCVAWVLGLGVGAWAATKYMPEGKH